MRTLCSLSVLLSLAGCGGGAAAGATSPDAGSPAIDAPPRTPPITAPAK